MREDLARHEGREAFQPPAGQAHPFAVGARHHDEAVGEIEAEELGLLPPHHVRPGRIALGDSRQDADGAPEVRRGRRMGTDRRKRERRVEIGRLHPAGPRAHHAAEKNGQVGGRAERGRRGADGNLVYFSSSPASTQASVANRFVAERADALAMLDAAR